MLKRQNVFTENFTIIFPNAGKTENEQKFEFDLILILEYHPWEIIYI